MRVSGRTFVELEDTRTLVGLAISVVRPVLQNCSLTAFASVPDPVGSPAKATNAAFAVARSPSGVKGRVAVLPVWGEVVESKG